MTPIFFYLLNESPGVSLEVDANTLLWAILTGLVVIVGALFTRHLNSQDKNYEKLEAKVDRVFERMDERIDHLEVGQAKIMAHLGID